MWTKKSKENNNVELQENGQQIAAENPAVTLKKQRIKLIIILALEFIAVLVIVLLILFAGKKSHTVTFDLNGGILLGGEVEQRVTQGQSANPPSVAKYGHYLRGWSGSYRSVTRDVTVKAIWEYETSPGIEYNFPEFTNYCEISGSFSEIQGDVYIGAYYQERQVLGIMAGAFKDRTGIKGVYLLDGILAIEDEAFMGCTSLEVIDIPSTVVRIGENAFAGCESLKEIVLPASLKMIEKDAFKGCTSLEKISFAESDEDTEVISLVISEGAFRDCSALTDVILNEKVETIGSCAFYNCTSLAEIIIPTSVKNIGVLAFNNAEMTIMLYISREEVPEGYEEMWHSKDATVIYDYDPTPIEEDEEGKKDDKDKDDEKDNDKNGFWGS